MRSPESVHKGAVAYLSEEESIALTPLPSVVIREEMLYDSLEQLWRNLDRSRLLVFQHERLL